MKRTVVVLADGGEECGALLVVDILRRAKMDVVTASVTARREWGSLTASPPPATRLSRPKWACHPVRRKRVGCGQHHHGKGIGSRNDNYSYALNMLRNRIKRKHP